MADRARAVEVQPLAPNGVRRAAVVDVQLKVVPEGEAETVREDVVEAGHVRGEVNLRRPLPAAIRRAAVVSVPKRPGAGIHPGDAHVAGDPRGDRRECVVDALRRLRYT